MPFAELLARSCFSFLEGASQPAELVTRASELGYGALALVDRDGLYGVARAHGALVQRLREGLSATKLVVGADLSLGGGHSLPLLALDVHGYARLCRLVTAAHDGQPKGEARLSLEAALADTTGLFALLPAPYDERRAALVREAFGDRVCIIVHRHLVADDRPRTARARRIARRLGLKIAASGRPLFHDPSRRPVADVFACIRHGTTLDRAGRLITPNAEAYLRPEEELRRAFRDDLPWLDNAAEVGERCSFSMSEIRYRFPCESIRPGESADQALCRLVAEHLPWRYPEGTPPRVEAQIGRELAMIAQLEVAPYFLCVHEIVQIAREKGILCQGRGSAANSAVCFALGITAVDPARSSLLFERFLSPERREPPDIDVDFEHERREEVIQAIYERYGRDRAAMVSEVICYRTRSALREVAKAFGLSLEQADALSSAASGHGKVTDERVREVGLDPEDPRLGRALEIAASLDGFPRHLSIHVGGFVLSRDPLVDVSPIEPARMEGRTVVQWDKDDIDTLGFFKVDVLALGMLTAIRKALELIHHPLPGSPLDVLAAFAAIPSEDPVVYDAFCAADTVGVFQIESRAQMAMLPQLKPRHFYDLVVEVALVRPGPIQGGMVHPYLRRRAGEEAIVCPHRSLEPIVERTLGVPLFQEQVMQIAIVGAGYTGGEADELRRDMAAWKKTGRLERHRQRLLDGFAARGITRSFGEALYRQIQGFGEYGFPESHAASFALLVYASGWLKVHYPAAFTCALLNSQPMGFYSPSSLVQDAMRHGVEVRDVSVCDSEVEASLEWGASRSAPVLGHPQPALRLGLSRVRGLPSERAEAIVAARRQQPFEGLDDLLRRVHLSARHAELLAESGALSPLVADRRVALWKARAPRQLGLFEQVPVDEPEPQLPELSEAETLTLDYGHKGLSVRDHPMRHYRPWLRGVATCEALARQDTRSAARVAGLVQSRQRPYTASGVVFMTIEDETGVCNVVLWADVFERFRFDVVHARVLLVEGTVERKGRVVHLIARSVHRLDGRGLDVRTASRDFH